MRMPPLPKSDITRTRKDLKVRPKVKPKPRGIGDSVLKVKPEPTASKAKPKVKPNKAGHNYNSIIRPHLLAGDATIPQIAEELAKQFPGAYDSKRFKANVWAAIVGYKRQGYTLARSQQGQVKVTAPAR